MKRNHLALMLALILVVSILPIGTAGAAANLTAGTAGSATKAFGTVYALYQPVVFDWSAYAGYGTTYNFAALNLKTLEVDLSHEGIPNTWSTLTSDVKASYMVYVEILDANGNVTKIVSDFLHFGAVVVAPNYIPEEKIQMRGILAKDAKKYPAFTDKYYEAVGPIVSNNPFFQDSNNDADSALWMNKTVNSNYVFDVFNVVRRGYGSSKYSYNNKVEADLFNLINLYRIVNNKPELVWNNTLGTFARLRITAASDNPYKNDMYDLSEVGGNGTSLITDFLRYGLSVPGKCQEWFWLPESRNWSDDAAYEIFDEWLTDEELCADILGDFKYAGIGAVKCSRLLGKKQTGLALMMELEN